MKLTKNERNIAKGAVVGGVIGACFGVPALGAIAGGIVNSDNDNKIKKNFNRECKNFKKKLIGK